MQKAAIAIQRTPSVIVLKHWSGWMLRCLRESIILFLINRHICCPDTGDGHLDGPEPVRQFHTYHVVCYTVAVQTE